MNDKLKQAFLNVIESLEKIGKLKAAATLKLAMQIGGTPEIDTLAVELAREAAEKGETRIIANMLLSTLIANAESEE